LLAVVAENDVDLSHILARHSTSRDEFRERGALGHLCFGASRICAHLAVCLKTVKACPSYM